MKKQLGSRKLRLNTETLRKLTSMELERVVAAGFVTITCATGACLISAGCTTGYGQTNTCFSRTTTGP
jgi:hypothetical protein